MSNKVELSTLNHLNIIPCVGKIPIQSMKGWNLKDAKLSNQIFNSCEQNNYALRADSIQAIDVDIYDSEMSKFYFEALCLYFNRDNIVYRVGQEPKFLIPCYVHSLNKKITIKTDNFTKLSKDIVKQNMVELFAGHNCYWMFDGVHVDTKLEYTWHNGTLNVHDLPIIEDHNNFIYFLDILNNLYKNIKKSNSYDEWFKIGAALHHYYYSNNSKLGLGLFDLFSSICGNYKGKADVEKQWNAYHDLTQARPITIKSLVGSDDDTLESERMLNFFFQDCAVVADGNLIADLSNSQLMLKKREEFKVKYLKHKYLKVDSKGKMSKIQAVDKWLHDPKCKVFDALTWQPISEREIEKDNKKLLNTFNCFRSKFNNKTVDYEFVSEVITTHAINMTDTQFEASLLLDYLAYIIQNPHKQVGVHLVSFATNTKGAGRGSITRLVSNILGAENCNTNVDTQDLSSGFNEYVAKKIFLSIQEFEISGRDKQEKYNKLKKEMTVSDDMILVNQKYMPTYLCHSAPHWFLHTNDVDAFPINHNERRFNIIRFSGYKSLNMITKKRGHSIAHHMNDTIVKDIDLLSSAYHFFNNREIKIYKPYEVVTIDAVQRAALDGASISEMDFQEFIDRIGRPFYANSELPHDKKSIFTRVAKRKGFEKTSVTVKGKSYRGVYLPQKVEETKARKHLRNIIKKNKFNSSI